MTLLVIAGHHRSGTSMLGQLMSRSNLFLGDRLMGATPGNPYGHFEDLEVVNLHDRLLHSHGLTWQVDRPFIPTVTTPSRHQIERLVAERETEHSIWGFKDPRVCLFLPLWKHLVPEAKILITFRHPTACGDSLERRQVRDLLERRGDTEMGWRFWTEPDHALKLWMVYNSALRRCAQAHPDDCLVVSFEQLQAGRNVVAELNQRWQLDLTETDPTAVFDPEVVTAKTTSIEASDQDLAEAADRLWSELCRLASESQLEGSVA